MPASQKDSKADSRQRLLDATRELLWCNSYGAVSVDDLCRHAEVNKGSFYHHFASKSALAMAAFEAYWEEMRPMLDRLFSPQVPPLERFDRYAAAYVEIQTLMRSQHEHVLGCPYTSLGCEAGAQESGLREIAALKATLSCRYFATAIRDAQAQGEIPPGDPERLALECQAFVAGTAAQARIQDSLDPFHRMAEGLRRLLGATVPATA